MSVSPLPPPRSGRLTRLMLKELREILRDRRTIGTLILMPLILYPLLSVGFQQFFLSGIGKPVAPQYHIGFEDATAAKAIMRRLVRDGGLPLTEPPEETDEASKSDENSTASLDVVNSKPATSKPGTPGKVNSEPSVSRILIPPDIPMPISEAVQQQIIDVGIRVKGLQMNGDRSDRGRNFQIELLWNRDSVLSKQALELLQKHFQRANISTLSRRLAVAFKQPRPQIPMQTTAIELEDPDKVVSRPGTGRSTSIMAIIPLILIMMTVTGAVYPAIDLTAGERERGTLEILVAAPIPRIGLLFAKYVAVVVVALLTAAVNLIMMAVTLFVSGVGQALFGPGGLSMAVIAQVFGLLILFAGFFSAVLLVLTSFARSFKEAQAYLIPLMLVSLAPGALCLKPDLHLSGLWLVTPLVNIVLLGRDLFSGAATGMAVVMVVVSTVLYALAAISLAARIFGAESVLYSTPSGWADMLQRPTASRSTSTASGALLTLALIFPLFFMLNGLLPRLASAWHAGVWPWDAAARLPDFQKMPDSDRRDFVESQLILAGVSTLLVFGVFPLLVALWRRIRLSSAFSLRRPAVLAVVGCMLLGVSLWMGAHELVLLQMRVGIASLDLSQIEAAQQLVATLRSVPLPLILLVLAAAPAICEEWFFRGLLLSALRRENSPWKAILISSVLFGLFHVVGRSGFTIERLLPSTSLGLVLGWVCWRTGSLFPGIVLHLLHNGLMLTVAYHEAELKARGWDISSAESDFRTGTQSVAHLPATWLAVGSLVATVGFLLVWVSRQRAASDLDRSAALP